MSPFPFPPQQTAFTDHTELQAAIEEWQLADWAFEAFVLVVPVTEAPYIVAGTNPLTCQMRADDDVRACCNASQRFQAAWGARSGSWSGTVCDLSAARTAQHLRNNLAETLLTAIAIGEGLASYTEALHGMVAFHRTGELPEVIEAKQAVRLLKTAVKMWASGPNGPAGI